MRIYRTLVNIKTSKPIHTYGARTAYLIITVAWGELNTTRLPSSTCLVLNSHQSSENSIDFFLLSSSFLFPLKYFTRLKGINWNEYINHGSQSIIINWDRCSCVASMRFQFFDSSRVRVECYHHSSSIGCAIARKSNRTQRTQRSVFRFTFNEYWKYSALIRLYLQCARLKWNIHCVDSVLANEWQNGMSVVHIYHLPIENWDRLQCDLFSLAVPLSSFGLFEHTNGFYCRCSRQNRLKLPV